MGLEKPADHGGVKLFSSDAQLMFADLTLTSATNLQVSRESTPSVLELCAGGGGQALGFERAGFAHAALIELDPHACATLKLNRPHWQIFKTDLRNFPGAGFKGIDVVAAGLPCPPFSVAGKQLGSKDDRNLFVVRRFVHHLGYRYRLHVASLPGKPDLVFPRLKKIIDVRGCFWHRHEGCPDCRVPSSRVDYWGPKLESNRQRDERNARVLRELGWDVTRRLGL